MTAELKILKFIGVDKKEQVLLKSFLNLAKGELEFDLQIDENHASPDVVVVDEEHAQAADVFVGVALKITIGNNTNDASDSYIHRPLQWSRFKSVLDKLGETQDQPPVENIQQQPVKKEQPTQQEQPIQKAAETPLTVKAVEQKVPQVQEPVVQQPKIEEPEQKVKPAAAAKVVEQPQQAEKQKTVKQQPTQQQQVQPPAEEQVEPEVVEFFPGEPEHEETQFSENAGEWELEISAQSEVVQGQAQVQVQESLEEVAVPEDEVGELYALNDDSIESPSEFLDNIEEMVIETDKVDQWDEKSISVDASESESLSSGEQSRVPKLNNLLDKGKAKTEKLLGEPLGDAVEFWSGDTEILLNNHTIFVIREKRGTVYTEYEPHKWYKIFSSGDMRQRKLDSKWKPYGRLENYPLDWLKWCAYITRSNGVLSKAINKKDLFLLESWPNFSLLQNDNNLLKLCSLSFINPESPRSLVMQSKLRARVIVGFVNAGYAMGLLSKHGNEDGDIVKSAANDGHGSSMTWFKDLFK